MRKTVLAAGLVACLAPAAFGSGYQVSLQGQKQIGMGHTGTGLVWDASSIFFNPGALSFLKKSNVNVGMSFINNKVGYLAPSPTNYSTQSESPISTPFTVYAAYKVKNLAFGIGVYTPYGSSVKWPAQWKGEALLQELTLRAIYIQPTVSYNINDIVGIGAGFTYATGGVNLKRQIPVYAQPGQFGQAELDGKASGFGFNAGLFVKPSEKFTIGASYRSKIDMKVDGGDATFDVSSVAKATGTFPRSGGTRFDATLPLPGVASIGIGVKPSEKLTLAADFNYTFWSAYKSLRFDYDSLVNGSYSTDSPRNYENSFAVRLGLDYQIVKALSVRAGAYYDQTPVQNGYMTPETPDADRIGLSLGVGVRPTEDLHIDASLLFINGMKREQTQADVDAAGTQAAALPGTYLIRAFIPGISVGYSF